MENKKFVVIGGGTGTYSVLSGLKNYTDNITAIVGMADSGGSAKKERDEWGLLPSSDIRKSLLALSNVSAKDPTLLRNLFQYRFSEGSGITGMSFGNLFLVALTKLLKSQEIAIEKAGEILQIKGQVLPVTFSKSDLVAIYEDGSIVNGEHAIDEPKHNGQTPIRNLYLKPKSKITSRADNAIRQSDYVIIGPGGFYTTIISNLVVDGVVEALKASKAKKIFILNLMTEFGQTYQFTASRFMNELGKYIPLNIIDYVLMNNAPIPVSILQKYKKFNATPVINDLCGNLPYVVKSFDLLSKKHIKREKGDMLQRSLIRHDPEKISNACMKILNLI